MAESVWKHADLLPPDGKEVLIVGRYEGTYLVGEKDRRFLGHFKQFDNQWYESKTDRKINARLWAELPDFD